MKEHLLAALAAAALAASPVAQTIVAAASGIAGSTHVIDFGSGVYRNFTTVVTEFEGITISHARYYTTDISNNLVGGFLTNDFSGTPTPWSSSLTFRLRI